MIRCISQGHPRTWRNIAPFGDSSRRDMMPFQDHIWGGGRGQAAYPLCSRRLATRRPALNSRGDPVETIRWHVPAGVKLPALNSRGDPVETIRRRTWGDSPCCLPSIPGATRLKQQADGVRNARDPLPSIPGATRLKHCQHFGRFSRTAACPQFPGRPG